MTKKELELKVLNLEKCVLALASRKVTEKAENAFSEALRIEAKADSAIDEVDEEVAEALLLIAEVMKGE